MQFTSDITEAEKLLARGLDRMFQEGSRSRQGGFTEEFVGTKASFVFTVPPRDCPVVPLE